MCPGLFSLIMLYYWHQIVDGGRLGVLHHMEISIASRHNVPTGLRWTRAQKGVYRCCSLKICEQLNGELGSMCLMGSVHTSSFR